MAKREENLKKINDELEKLSDEQLERVAGGNSNETIDDSLFLNCLNGSTDRYGMLRISVEDHDKEIRDAWAKVGVEAEIHSGNFIEYGKLNVYKINGKVVERDEAIKHAMKVTGHYMDWGSWDW